MPSIGWTYSSTQLHNDRKLHSENLASEFFDVGIEEAGVILGH